MLTCFGELGRYVLIDKRERFQNIDLIKDKERYSMHPSSSNSMNNALSSSELKPLISFPELPKEVHIANTKSNFKEIRFDRTEFFRSELKPLHITDFASDYFDQTNSIDLLGNTMKYLTYLAYSEILGYIFIGFQTGKLTFEIISVY